MIQCDICTCAIKHEDDIHHMDDVSPIMDDRIPDLDLCEKCNTKVADRLHPAWAKLKDDAADSVVALIKQIIEELKK